MTDPNADTGNASHPADAVPLDTIRQWGQELGFQALGFTGIDLAQHRDYLAKWLEAGYHGEMEWMASHGQGASAGEEEQHQCIMGRVSAPQNRKKMKRSQSPCSGSPPRLPLNT